MALAMADRFELNPRDIVYVDASGLATWNRFIGLILPTLNATISTFNNTSNAIQHVQYIHNEGWK